MKNLTAFIFILFFALSCGGNRSGSNAGSVGGTQYSCAGIKTEIKKLESIREQASNTAQRTTSPAMTEGFHQQAIQAQNRIRQLTKELSRCR